MYIWHSLLLQTLQLSFVGASLTTSTYASRVFFFLCFFFLFCFTLLCVHILSLLILFLWALIALFITFIIIIVFFFWHSFNPSVGIQVICLYFFAWVCSMSLCLLRSLLTSSKWYVASVQSRATYRLLVLHAFRFFYLVTYFIIYFLVCSAINFLILTRGPNKPIK